MDHKHSEIDKFNNLAYNQTAFRESPIDEVLTFQQSPNRLLL